LGRVVLILEAAGKTGRQTTDDGGRKTDTGRRTAEKAP